jgi:hypothetical protein
VLAFGGLLELLETQLEPVVRRQLGGDCGGIRVALEHEREGLAGRDALVLGVPPADAARAHAVAAIRLELGRGEGAVGVAPHADALGGLAPLERDGCARERGAGLVAHRARDALRVCRGGETQREPRDPERRRPSRSQHRSAAYRVPC